MLCIIKALELAGVGKKSICNFNFKEYKKAMSVIITVIGFHCYRCDHEWVPAKLIHAPCKNPVMPICCPKCKSPFWKSPREKDIIKIIKSGIFQSYNLTALNLFVKSHVKAGDDTAKILDIIYSLPKLPPDNPKLWLEERWLEK